MILGIILLLLIILAIGLFAHHWLVQQRNREAVRFSDSEATARLAIEGLDFTATALEKSGLLTGSSLIEVFPALFRADDLRELDLGTGTCRPGGSPGPGGRHLDRIAADYQRCLETITREFDDRLGLLGGGTARHPLCQGISVKLRSITRLQPSPPQPRHLAAGWDHFERRGEAVIACQVYFMGVSRVAVTVRQFKLVSMIPGPYARFTLFVHHAPHADCYNVVRNRYDGSPDSRGGGPPFRPLILFNSPAPLAGEHAASPAKAQEELRTKGWVYLGQSPGGPWNRDPATLRGAISLRIPSGYLPDTGEPPAEELPSSRGFGGHAYLAPATVLRSGAVGVPGYPLAAAGLYRPDAPGGPYEIQQKFQGFYTHDPTTGKADDQGAASVGAWTGPDGPLPPDDCTTTWILPFGERRRPSRTLLFGATFAEFLLFYVLRGPDRAAMLLPPPPVEAYDPLASVTIRPAAFSPPAAQDLFLPSSDDPPGKPGWKAWQSVMPRVVAPRLGNPAGPACAGMAANLLFDLMAYQALPDIFRSRSTQPWGIGQLETLTFGLPGNNQAGTLNRIDEISDQFHPCLQPLTNVHLWRHHEPADLTPTAGLHTVFLGDLQGLMIRNDPAARAPRPRFDETTNECLLARVTQVIDLRGQPPDQATRLLGERVFRLAVPGDSGPEWEPRHAGICLLRRDPGEPPVALPGPIRLSRPLVLLLEHGDLALPAPVIDPLAAGPGRREVAPRVLCSLIALDGRIRVAPGREIHAFLVALNPSLSEAPDQGGRLLAWPPGSGGNPDRKLLIKGGVAVIELAPGTPGPSTMEEFPGGGVIRYNTGFNVSLPSARETYAMVLANRNGPVTVTGGEE